MKQKHLSLSERQDIEMMLNQGASFRAIAKALDRSPTTITNEVKKRARHHRSEIPYRTPNACLLRYQCVHYEICPDCPFKQRKENCRFCWHCNDRCIDFQEETCALLLQPPYVCNACEERNKCTLRRVTYQAKQAHINYADAWQEDRQGFYLTGQQMKRVSDLVTPRLKQGQSLYAIYQDLKDQLPCSMSTVYRLIEQEELLATNFDLPRRIRHKPTPKKRLHKVDRQCHIGRSYDDYLRFVEQHQVSHTVQMDTVEGCMGSPVLLSLGWVEDSLIRLHRREHNDAKSVEDIFNWYEEILGLRTFQTLFPVSLGDRGTEFSNPSALEFSPFTEERRTWVFYCDPRRSDQKGALERAHVDVRRIFPKGTHFGTIQQHVIDLACDHLNSYPRKKLKGKTPIESFSFFLSDDIPVILGWKTIRISDIHLTPDYFIKK